MNSYRASVVYAKNGELNFNQQYCRALTIRSNFACSFDYSPRFWAMRGTNRKPQREAARLLPPPTPQHTMTDTLTHPHAREGWHVAAALHSGHRVTWPSALWQLVLFGGNGLGYCCVTVTQCCTQLKLIVKRYLFHLSWVPGQCNFFTFKTWTILTSSGLKSMSLQLKTM